MKKVVFVVLLLTPLISRAQKGAELQFDGGIGWMGADPWIRTGILSVTGLYNVNSTIAIGPVFTTGINTKFFVGEENNNYKANITELGVLARFTLLRAGKFKWYGAASVAKVSGKADNVEEFRSTSLGSINLDDSSVGFGFGTGAMLNLGGKVYVKILDFHMRVLKKDFMDMDKGFHKSVGPLFAFKSGIAFTF